MTGPNTGGPPSGPKAGTELVHIPFRDGEVWAVEINGKPWIVLRHAFAAIGLDADRQILKLRSQEWATTSVTAVVADDDRIREMVVCDLRTFLMALATIPASRVSERVRPTLIAYQNEVADAIESYWTRGHATNPRGSELAAPRVLSLDETAAMLRQHYALPYTVVDLTRAMRAAGITRLSGGPKKDHFSLLWFNGSAWCVVADYLDILARVLRRNEQRVQELVGHGVQLSLDDIESHSPALQES